jgi:hypothetical protein
VQHVVQEALSPPGTRYIFSGSARRVVTSSPARLGVSTNPCTEKNEVNRYLLIVSAAFLAACATTAEYESVLSPWSGAQEVELVRSWGYPDQSYEAGGRKFIVYESRRKLHLPGTPAILGGEGRSSSVGSPAMDIELFCATTFELENSKVTAWSFKGNDCNAKKGARFRT